MIERFDRRTTIGPMTTVTETVSTRAKLSSESITLSEQTIARVLGVTASRFHAFGIETAELDARVLLGHVLGMTWSDLILHADRQTTADERARLENLVARRLQHEPTAYLTGKREFWGLEFAVDRSTLIPRPDSETIIESVLAANIAESQTAASSFRILDLGTGSGCLLIALLTEISHGFGVGVDSSADALNVARHNADSLGVGERCTFYQSDWDEKIDGRFNVIVSNPPYIADCDLTNLPQDVYQFEPRDALYGGIDGLAAYRATANFVSRLLVPGGIIAVEIGAGQADLVERILFDQSELMFLKSYPDLSGTIRVLVGQKRNIEKTVGMGSPTR